MDFEWIFLAKTLKHRWLPSQMRQLIIKISSKKSFFFNKNAETSVAAEPNESRKVAKFLKKTVTKYDFATGSSRPLFQPNLTKTLKRRRRHEAFGSTATDVSAFSLQLAKKGTENSKLLCNNFLRIYANLLDAFGSAATDVSAFSLIFFDEFFMIFRVPARIFAFPANSNGSAATDVSAFWKGQFLQRDFKEFTTGFTINPVVKTPARKNGHPKNAHFSYFFSFFVLDPPCT